MALTPASVLLLAFAALARVAVAQTCQPGFFRTTDPASSAPICAPCPTATFSDTVDAASCRACSPNSIPSDAQNTCFCLPGFLFNTSTQACSLCPAGTFLPALNTDFATTCIQCTANSAPNAQRTTCYCNQGFFFNDQQGCSPCPPGTFRAGANIDFATSCTPCPDGQFQPVAGGSACIPCVGGTIANAARTICIPGVITPPLPPGFPTPVTPNIPNIPDFLIPESVPNPPQLLLQ